LIFSISASQEARITGMSHWHLLVECFLISIDELYENHYFVILSVMVESLKDHEWMEDVGDRLLESRIYR
jgi:hypothetical protein